MRPTRSTARPLLCKALGMVLVTLAAGCTALPSTSEPPEPSPSPTTSVNSASILEHPMAMPSIEASVPAPEAWLDPSASDWISRARLGTVCRFPVADVIRSVLDVPIRAEEMTAPQTAAGSVCQYWVGSSFDGTGSWWGNLHAYPPTRSHEDLREAARDLRGVPWREWTHDGHLILSNFDYLLIGHDQVTLWLILPMSLGGNDELMREFTAAVLDAVDVARAAD
jgi:hypothetical protein